MSVELFAPYDTGYITTGEHIFFQVKATDTLEIMNLSVSPATMLNDVNDQLPEHL